MISDKNVKSASAEGQEKERIEAYDAFSMDHRMPKSRFIRLICGISLVTVFCIIGFAVELWQRNAYLTHKQQLEEDIASYKQYIAELPGMRQEYSELTLELDKNRAALKAVTQEYSAKKQAYDEASAVLARYEALKGEVGELNAGKAKLTNEIADLQADKKTLNQEISTLKDDASKYRKNAADLQNEVSKLESKKQAAEVEILALEKRFNDLKAENSSLNVLTKSLTEMKDSIAGVITEYEGVADKLDAQLDENTPNSLAFAARQYQEHLSTLGLQETDFKTQLQYIGSASSRYKQLNDNYAAEITALQSKNKDLQNVNLTAPQQQLTTSADNLNQALAALNRELDNLQKLIGSGTESGAASGVEPVSLNSALTDLNKLKDTLADAAESYQQTAMQAGNTQSSFAGSQSSLQQTADSLTQQSTQLGNLITALATAQQQTATAAAQLSESAAAVKAQVPQQTDDPSAEQPE